MAITKRTFRARRLKLAKFLRTLKRSQFDIHVWQNECGTTRCAGGWCPTVFPRDFHMKDGCPLLRKRTSNLASIDLTRFFGNVTGDHQYPFYSIWAYKSMDPAPSTVAARIESIGAAKAKRVK